MKYITKEVRIGIAGIIALCVLIYGINWLKGIHMFQPSSYFYAKFQNVNGLTKSSPVFADGVRVGIVPVSYTHLRSQTSACCGKPSSRKISAPK